MTTISLVTGSNRGIGLEVVRQLAGDHGHTVLLGSRSPQKGRAAAAPLADAGLTVVPVALDVTDPSMVAAVAARVDATYGRLDVLVNNAAVDYDTDQRAVTADLDRVRSDLETNVFGAWRLLQALLDLLRRSEHPRVVNVSSGSGALTGMGGGTPAYGLSKAGLNVLTRKWAAELRGDGVLVNSVCPGWVATDMGGAGGRPVAEGAAGVVWAATLGDGGPTGGFFRDRRPIDW